MLYDLIIVGGGPAGSTMALFAARAGLRTLLLDKHTFPRDKICGDAIPQEALDVVETLGLTPALFSGSPHRVRAWRLYAHGEVLDHDWNQTTSVVMPRRKFDAVLFEAARDVVDTLEGARVTQVLTHDGTATGVAGTRADGQAFRFSGRVIAGADGYASIVARSMGVYPYARDHVAVATRIYYRGLEKGSPLEFHYDRRQFPDYFWIFPVDEDTTNVGYIRFLSNPGPASVRTRHEALEQSPRLAARFAGAEALTPMKGWPLPLASTRRPIHGDGFVLLGDAAGLIDPFMGHGIDHAMRSGQLAAEVVAHACATGDVSANGLAGYARALDETIADYLKSRMWLHRHLPPRFTFPLRSLLYRFNTICFGGRGTLRPDSESQEHPWSHTPEQHTHERQPRTIDL